LPIRPLHPKRLDPAIDQITRSKASSHPRRRATTNSIQIRPPDSRSELPGANGRV